MSGITVKDKLLANWKNIASLILLAALILSIQRCNSERSERLKMVAELTRQETIAKIEAQKWEIAAREKKYPVIDKRLKDIEIAKGKVRKGITDEVKKADIDRLASMFRGEGYNCLVMAK